MIIVSDSGPILSFARAGHLEILRQVAGELLIPEAVFVEIAVRGKGNREPRQFVPERGF